MSDEAKADALEDAMSHALDETLADDPQKKFPTAAEVEAQIRYAPHSPRSQATFFIGCAGGNNVKVLSKMPDQPTFLDFFRQRFHRHRETIACRAPTMP